jgi:thymidine kinase
MRHAKDGTRMFPLLFSMLIISTIFASTASANPPKTVSAEYDLAAQKLTVKIDHSSFSPSMHYIKTVEVTKNGKVVLAQAYKNQPDKNPFEYSYDLPAAAGDVLEIKATCNMYGSKTISMTITKPIK